MFNAMHRDWRFGVPMMLMIAIAYRESRTPLSQSDAEQPEAVSAIGNRSSEMAN